jgi:RNA polymerase sigma factor for flagellar operon FliA
MNRAELEALFLEHLATVDRIVAALARRHALTPDAADEFASWAKLQIIEDDYAVLGKFRGESSLTTYLTVVFAMLYRDYRVRELGRWRPSAAARRGGAIAIRLETLTRRDGLSLTQAAHVLRTAGETTLSDRELSRVVERLPSRAPLRPVVTADLPTEAVGTSNADDKVRGDEQAADAAAAERALAKALDTLTPEDRLIVRMHYVEGLSVAEIARGLSLPQKPLYRRIDRSLGFLRQSMERLGVSRDHVREIAIGPNS